MTYQYNLRLKERIIIVDRKKKSNGHDMDTYEGLNQRLKVIKVSNLVLKSHPGTVNIIIIRNFGNISIVDPCSISVNLSRGSGFSVLLIFKRIRSCFDVVMELPFFNKNIHPYIDKDVNNNFIILIMKGYGT